MSVGRVHAFQDLEALGYRAGLTDGTEDDYRYKREELTRKALSNGATRAEADIRFGRGLSLGKLSKRYKEEDG